MYAVLRVIMRRSYSGGRFSCLGCGLLALFLSAPISVNAQSASSPQSQAAQSAAPPPPTQSQTQSMPPCSDAPPILKRGKQADLPPCPDPPPAASPPADSMRARSLTPAEALIERARGAAFEFSENLPNFICQEFMARFSQRGREQTPLDVVSAEIIYSNGQESYRNVKINDRRKSVGRGPPESLRLHCSASFRPTLMRNSGPAPRLPLRVSVPRFTTFKCAVKIRTGRCRPALRL